MPNNKGKGGKKHRKQKNENISKRDMIWKEDGQAYAVIEKMLGNGRVHLCYFTRDEEGRLKRNQALGIIRGTMRRKKVWINTEDIVLVSIREFEEGKVDILHKYDYDETKSLQSMKEIPKVEDKEIDTERKSPNTIVSSEDEEEILFTNDAEYEQDEEDFLNNL
jgi:translation initiation factor 1A